MARYPGAAFALVLVGLMVACIAHTADAVAQSISRCEIQTPFGGILNTREGVRSFIKDPGNVDEYDSVEIRFAGRRPELVCYKMEKNGAETQVERVDMTDLSTEQCHELLRERGIARIAAAIAEDPEIEGSPEIEGKAHIEL
eukprot:3935094-Amphidinium_carterae.1